MSNSKKQTILAAKIVLLELLFNICNTFFEKMNCSADRSSAKEEQIKL